MTTNVILEWRNLDLTIRKSEFSILKCRKQVEEKQILDNGKQMKSEKYFFFRN